MKKAVLGLVVILLSGCGAGSEISSIFTPSREGSRVPVIYPAEKVSQSEGSAMVQSYGPSWENVSVEYPEYRFN